MSVSEIRFYEFPGQFKYIYGRELVTMRRVFEQRNVGHTTITISNGINSETQALGNCFLSACEVGGRKTEADLGGKKVNFSPDFLMSKSQHHLLEC